MLHDWWHDDVCLESAYQIPMPTVACSSGLWWADVDHGFCLQNQLPQAASRYSRVRQTHMVALSGFIEVEPLRRVAVLEAVFERPFFAQESLSPTAVVPHTWTPKQADLSKP